MNRRDFLAASSTAAVLANFGRGAAAQPPATGFNEKIMTAVRTLYDTRRGGGYGGPGARDTTYAFTRNLDYGAPAAIPQSPPTGDRDPAYVHATMCVASTAEIIIEAIDAYSADPQRAFDKVDARAKVTAAMWTRGNLTALRPYIWMQSDDRDVFKYKRGQVPRAIVKGRVVNALSRGTAHAFSIFRIGEELPFADLVEGDFINLNREHGPGHSVVFCGFIGPDNTHTPIHSPGVLGFAYFSAQGPKIGGGFDYRDAYFGPGRHNGPTAGHKADPGIIMKQTSQLYLNSGRLWTPDRWDTAGALDEIRKKVLASTAGQPSRDLATSQALEQDQGPPVMTFIDGSDD